METGELLLEIVHKALRPPCELEEHLVESIGVEELVNQQSILHLSSAIVL
jgi:hypothetical protein